MALHERVRDVKQKSTGKLAVKCTCKDFHPTHRDEMDINISISKDDIEELHVHHEVVTVQGPATGNSSRV